jgi:hypothetical protein
MMKVFVASYRHLKLLVIFLVAILLIVIYNNNIRTTIRLYQEYDSMSSKLNQNTDLLEKVDLLQKKLEGLGTTNVNSLKKDSVSQSKLLDIVSQTCATHSLKLYYLGDPSYYSQQQYSVELNIISLEGTFLNLTKAIHSLEETNSLKASLMSVDYKLMKSYYGRKDQLVATLYFQRFNGVTYE